MGTGVGGMGDPADSATPAALYRVAPDVNRILIVPELEAWIDCA